MNIRHYTVLIFFASAIGILHAQQAATAPPASSSQKNPSAEKPLPDIASLFREVQAHQKELENVRKNYMFRAVSQEDELDSDGHVKHSKSEEHEVFFVGRHTVSRLLRKDGVDL